MFKNHNKSPGLPSVQSGNPTMNTSAVNLSVAGHKIVPIPNTYMYSASKHAVTVLTEGLRKELQEQNSNIRVTVSITLIKSLT